MRNFFIVALLMLSVSAMGQTFNFEPSTQSAGASYEPPTEEVLAEFNWLTPTSETFDPGDGVERMVLTNAKNGWPVVHMRGKYFVYLSSLTSPGTVTYKGREYPVYPGKPGKYIMFLEGDKGLWGKTVSPSTK